MTATTVAPIKKMPRFKVLLLAKTMVLKLTRFVKTDPRLHSYCSNVSKIDGMLAHIGVDYSQCAITFGFSLEYYDHFMIRECKLMNDGFERSLTLDKFKKASSSSSTIMYVNLFHVDNDEKKVKRLPSTIRRIVKWLLRENDSNQCTYYKFYQ